MGNLLYTPRPDRWPRFSLRGLLILVAVAGASLWTGMQLRWLHDRHQALLEASTRSSGEKVVHAPWSLRIFGEEGVEVFVIDLNQPKEAQKRERERLAILFPEAEFVEEYMWRGIPVVG